MGKCSKDKRDIYYRRAKEEGWRARSAFKLLQIQEQFDIFSGVTKVVDLCAAPGSWSQVLSRRLYGQQGNQSDVRIVAVDLQPMAPLEGVVQLQGDITSMATVDRILEQFGGDKAQLVLSDGAPDVTGMHDVDEYIQSQLILAALSITAHILAPGGSFVAKVFRGKDTVFLHSQLSALFRHVTVSKPKSSRNSSVEAFVVCQDYHPPTSLDPSSLLQFLSPTPVPGAKLPACVTFVACGDLTAQDADQSYSLTEANATPGDTYCPKDAPQPPTEPAYQRYLNARRAGQIAKQ